MTELSLKHILTLSSTGLIMGLFTSLVGVPPQLESIVWVAWYVLWVFFLEHERCARPFSTVLIASLASGLLASAAQIALFDAYVTHNPDVAAKLNGMTRFDAAPGFVTQGLLAALMMGVIVGAIASLRQRRRE